MKLTKIRAAGPTLIDFPLVNTDPDGPYVLKGVDGLGAVEVAILNDGRVIPNQREVVLLVGLQPAYNIGQTSEQLRTEMYGLMTPKGKNLMELQLMDGATIVAFAEGRVKRIEPGLFTPDPEVQITVSCLGATRSYFMGKTFAKVAATIATAGSDKTFTFDNPGTAPTGFRMGLSFGTAVTAGTGVLITDTVSGGQSMHVHKDFAVGDFLIIDTREGSRGVWKSPAGGAEVSLLNEFDEDSDWMTLHHGENVLRVTGNVSDGGAKGGVWLTPTYLGV